MSAFVVHEDHIRLMVQAAIERRDRLHYRHNGAWVECGNAEEQGDPDRLCSMLYATNVASVNYRYNETDESEPLTFHRVVRLGELNTVEVLKAIDCYEYQSCEPDNWKESEAAAFCEALRHVMIQRLPGYSTAPWGWQRPEHRKAS